MVASWGRFVQQAFKTSWRPSNGGQWNNLPTETSTGGILLKSTGRTFIVLRVYFVGTFGTYGLRDHTHERGHWRGGFYISECISLGQILLYATWMSYTCLMRDHYCFEFEQRFPAEFLSPPTKRLPCGTFAVPAKAVSLYPCGGSNFQGFTFFLVAACCIRIVLQFCTLEQEKVCVGKRLVVWQAP